MTALSGGVPPALRAGILVALLAVGCKNGAYVLRSGQITTIERGDHCFVTVQDPDPMVLQGPSRFEVTCAAVADLNPGDHWPVR